MQLLFPLSLPPLASTATQLGSAPETHTRLAQVQVALKAAGLQRSRVHHRVPESQSLQDALSHEVYLQKHFSLARLDIANVLMCQAARPNQSVALDTRPESCTWLLKPVHLNLALDHLVLAADARGTAQLNNLADWLVLLREALEPGWTLDTWISPRQETFLTLQTPLSTDWSPKSSAQAMGRSIDRYLPAGVNARSWRRFLNHTQMLLHEHPLNEQRELTGLARINGFWLEGEVKKVPQQLFRASMNEFLEDHKNSGDSITKNNDADTAVIIIDDWIAPTHQGDLDAWNAAWKRFAVFARALPKTSRTRWNFFGEAAQLTIESQPGDAWRVWRVGPLIE